MKTLLRLSLLAILAFAIAACQPAANTNTNTNTNAAPKAAAPTAEALLDIDKKAWEAWSKKDAKFFETYLADSFVGFDDKGKRSDRAATLKAIAEHNCDVKSYSLSDPHLTSVTSDVAVITYKGAVDGTCGGNKIPANTMVATVMVRSGDTWKGAYHNEVAIMEAPKAADANSNQAAAKPAEKKDMPPPPPPKEEKPAANASNTASASNSNTASSDPLTDAVMAVEKRGWEAWMKQDAKALEEVIGKDVAFIDVAGHATFGKAEVIKGWTDGSCKVSSVNVTDGKATNISKDVAILTYKGTAVGTCGDMKLMPLWGTTIAVNEGGSWKAVYVFETPAS